MALLLDTGPIVAALDEDDPEHDRCLALLTGGDDRLVPSPILAEVDYWLSKLGSLRAWADFAADINGGAYRLIHPSEADLIRAAELELVYADLRLGFVDASIIALAERLNETRIAPLDRRQCSVARPRHGPHLTLMRE